MTQYERLWTYGHDAVEDYIALVEGQIAKMYRDAYKSVSGELSDFYARFGSIDDANKYNRLANLKKAIGEEYRKVTGKSIELTGDTSTASVTGAYESAWFNLEAVSKQSLEFGILPADAIRASVFSEYSGAAFPYRFGKLYQSTLDTVAEAITRGLATGSGYAKTAGEVKKAFGISFNDTLRIIRTESTRCFTEGFQAASDRAKELGVKAVDTWLSTFDLRTRQLHAKMNGLEKSKDGFYHKDGLKTKGPGLWGIASQDILCRCTEYMKLADVEGTPDWSYDAWKKNFDEWKQLPPKQRKISIKFKG